MKIIPNSDSIPLPRPATDAKGIIALFFTDAVTGKPLRSARWVRNHVPFKRRASHSCVLWYIEDVQRWVDGLAA